jgi:flagellar motor switch/type III secretory pathway protein FliN
MSPRAVTRYPWQALESVSRGAARRARRARRVVQAALDLPRLSSALSALIECDASVIVQRVSCDSPRRRPLTELGFEIGTSGVLCALCVEPEFATNVLARVLRRPLALGVHAALDDTLSGALNAIVIELARRCSAHSAFHLLAPEDALARANDVFVEATVLIAGTPYPVLVALGLPELSVSEIAPLSSLGELAIALPVVAGWSLAERTALADFLPGNAWFPGAGLWLDPSGHGPVALAAPGQDWGVAGALSRDGKIVIRGERVQLLPDAGEPMSDSVKSEASLAEAVLNSPIVVRVEVGTVSLTAREWAELGPGDVIETGRRIAEPVILRVAGREVARGELVNLEGELGVRIRELIGP